jgi:hypothetical protein
MLTRAFDRCKAERADGGRIRATIPRLESGGGVLIVNLIRWRVRTNRAMLSPDVGRLQSNLVAADRAVPVKGDA